MDNRLGNLKTLGDNEDNEHRRVIASSHFIDVPFRNFLARALAVGTVRAIS